MSARRNPGRNPGLAPWFPPGGIAPSLDPPAGSWRGQSAGPPGMGPEPALIHEPGGDVLRQLLHPNFEPMEEMYARLSEPGWFATGVAPNRPVQFELGAFTVPSGQHFWLFDYEFTVFRFNGADGAAVPAEEQRFRRQIGFDVTVAATRLSHLLYQLVPSRVEKSVQAYEPQYASDQPPPRANAGAFQRAAASGAITSGQGLSMLPDWGKRQGARGLPFTWIAEEGDRVELTAIIFDQLRVPVPFIEGRLAGVLVESNESSALLNRLRPR